VIGAVDRGAGSAGKPRGGLQYSTTGRPWGALAA